jgi:hypothetical protein
VAAPNWVTLTSTAKMGVKVRKGEFQVGLGTHSQFGLYFVYVTAALFVYLLSPRGRPRHDEIG